MQLRTITLDPKLPTLGGVAREQRRGMTMQHCDIYLSRSYAGQFHGGGADGTVKAANVYIARMALTEVRELGSTTADYDLNAAKSWQPFHGTAGVVKHTFKEFTKLSVFINCNILTVPNLIGIIIPNAR